jgi:histidine triad (HIT) family protein
MLGFEMQEPCIFCKIITKQLPATVIAETDDILVIKDLYPKSPVHYLILPKKHITDLQALENADRALAANILFMAQLLSQDLPGSKAFRLVSNNGHEAGQRVFHVHIHFLAGCELEF